MFLQAAALGKQLYDITDSELASVCSDWWSSCRRCCCCRSPVRPPTDSTGVASARSPSSPRERVDRALRLRGERPDDALPLFVLAAVFGVAGPSPPRRSGRCHRCWRRGSLPRLMAFYTATWMFGLIVGPASSGFLYDVDTTVPYAVAAAGFVTSARRSGRTPPPASRHARHRSAAHPPPRLEGLRFVRTAGCCSVRSGSTCSPCCSVGRWRCCRRSPRIASASATSATGGCAPRRASAARR